VSCVVAVVVSVVIVGVVRPTKNVQCVRQQEAAKVAKQKSSEDGNAAIRKVLFEHWRTTGRPLRASVFLKRQ